MKGTSAGRIALMRTIQKIRTDMATHFKLKRARTHLRIIGNSLGIKSNFLYFSHHVYSQIFSRNIKLLDKDAYRVDKLKKEGVITIPGIDVDSASKWVLDYFEKNPCPSGQGTVRRKEAGILAPHVYEMLLQIEPFLDMYFKSHFQCFLINIDHMEAGFSPKAESSSSYHLDDNPRQLMKVFFYLNDTYEQNAAFRAFNYETTKALIRKGFISLTPELRVSSQKFITPSLEKENLRLMEGPKGTALIFDNNIIHKGTPPKVGYRNVIIVEVLPSPKRFTLESIFEGLTKDLSRDFPDSPFSKEDGRTFLSIF